MRTSTFSHALLGFTLLCMTQSVLAHRVNVFAWTQGDVLHTESKFSGGTRVHFGTIRVEDLKTHESLLEGKTNEKGEFSTTIPTGFDRTHGLKVTIDAGEGHQSTWTVLPEDLTAMPVVAPKASPAKSQAPAIKRPAGGTLSEADLEAIDARVAARVAAEVAPIKRDLAQLATPSITLKDIVGGLGWILGLFGVGALVSRKKGPSA